MFIINSALEQFTIFDIVNLYIFSISNFTYFLILVFIIIIYYYVPNFPLKGCWIDLIYLSILDTVMNFLPVKYRIYLPIALSLFLYILVGNLVGLIPYSYSITCEIMLSLTISISILIGVTIIGFRKHGLHYFSYFLPNGTPLGLVPLLVLIELVSYIAKGLSLGIRLAGNIISGHLLLHIISGFIYKLTPIINVLVLLPLILLIALMGLEFVIAFLQSYVFVILFTVYLKDSIELH